MYSKIFKFFLGIILMLVVSGLLAFNALLMWVATGERSLEAITPYLENALSSSDGSYDVKIGKTRLIWDGWKHPVDIRLGNVSVFTREGKKFTSFPEISLGIDVLYLPLGRIMATSLTISNPRMNLVQYEDMTYGFSFKQEAVENEEPAEQTVPFSAIIAPFLSGKEDSNFRRLRSVTIKDASLSVRNSRQGVFFDASDVNLALARNRRGEIKINTIANIFYKDIATAKEYSTNISSEFSLKTSHPVIDGFLEFSELHPNILAALFTEDPAYRSFAVPISGKASLSLTTTGTLQSVEFDIKGGQGTIHSDQLISSLSITSLSLTGAIGNNMSDMRLDTLQADIDGIILTATGRGQNLNIVNATDSEPEITGTIKILDIPAERIKNLWPPALSPMTREWVTENITEGKVVENTVLINIKKGDLKLPVLPKESIDANLAVENLKIRYLPEHPPITKVNGNIHIDGVSLTADIESADFLEKTKLSKGTVTIADLNVDNPYINVNLHAESPAKDMVHFLGLPRLNHSGHLGLSESGASGNVKGEATVGFNFFAPEGVTAEEAIIYDVKANAENISQKNFLQKFDVVGASGTISVNNSGVEFSGTGEVNGAKVSKGHVKYFFTPQDGIDTILDLTASTSVANLKRFGYPEFPFLKGSIAATAKVKLGPATEQNEASLDLTSSEVNFSKFITWKKPVGEEVILDITTDKKDSGLKITSFNFTGKKIFGKGSATLSKNMEDFTYINLSDLKLGANDITRLDYQLAENGTLNISVNGSSVDISDHMNSSSEGFSFENFPAIQLKSNIGRLILDTNRSISSLNGEFSCDKMICRHADFTGTTGENKIFTIKISGDPKKKRQLAIRSEDAGSFMRSFGVLDGMGGGTLNLTGTYLDSTTLKGRLDISEHSIKDAPVLGRILSLASLTGFIDALQGNGITFRNMNMPFTLKNDVITIEKGKTYGPAIGLTLDGTITFPKKTLDIDGTVVPSYTLNNFFGKVPLLGPLLTGGEGQGIFAARYSIKGPSDKPEISVNPLSILTPGFLRGLFDIFDDKPEDKTSEKPAGRSSKTKNRKPDYPE